MHELADRECENIKQCCFNKINTTDSQNKDLKKSKQELAKAKNEAKKQNCFTIEGEVHPNEEVTEEGVTERYTIDLTPRNTLLGCLPNRREILVLVDSGATESIVSQQFVDNSMVDLEIEYEHFKEPIKLGIANGDYIFADKKIKIPIRFGRIKLILRALVVPNDLGGIDVIFGSSDLSKHKAKLDFSSNSISFVKGHNTIMRVMSEIYVPAKGSKSVRIYGKVPKIFKERCMVIKATGFGRKILPERSLVDLKNGYCDVLLVNDTDRRIKINNNARIARIDVETSFLKRDPVNLVEDKCYVTQNWDDQEERMTGEDYEITPDCEEYYNRMSRKQLRKYNAEKYPFLDSDDKRLSKNPYEILRDEIDLDTNSMLPESKKDRVMCMLEDYQNAFSLYGEIGKTDHVIDLNLTSTESKYIRPYNIGLNDRDLVDREMKRLLQLGVIKEGLATFSSPVMLIAKKDANSKPRVVLDLRVLNKRITKLNTNFPMIEDCLQQIGSTQSCYLSALDITDAFFGLKLSKESQMFAGISTYSGGKSYYFERLPQGLSISPSCFSNYILQILSEIPGHQKWLISYIDDILIHSSSIEEHLDHIEQVLAVLERHKLKIKPSKAHLFKKSLDYLGHTLLIKDGRPHVCVQRSKIDAITNMKPPTNLKGIRSFCGAVGYISKFLPNLSELLKPLRKLTKKSVRFHWDGICQENFEKIKQLISKPPVLHLPRKDHIFRLYIDTSREATGASIYQVPNKDSNDEKLIGFYSHNLPPAAKSYSVSELEATGILITLSALKYLKSQFIQIFTDHSALVHIMRSEREPPTMRMKEITEKLRISI